MRPIGYEQKAKNTNIENPELEERYQEIVDTLKKAAAKKGHEVHDTGNNAKDQVERENPAAAEAEHTLTEAEAQCIAAESTLVEAVAQEIERRSMKRSSTVANQRCVPAQHEHRRQDGWTSTPRGSDVNDPPVKIEDEEDAHEVVTGSGCSGGCDLLAGERLPKQRPLGDEHPERNPEEHLVAQVPHQVEEAGSIVSKTAEARACSRTTTKKYW